MNGDRLRFVTLRLLCAVDCDGVGSLSALAGPTVIEALPYLALVFEYLAAFLISFMLGYVICSLLQR